MKAIRFTLLIVVLTVIAFPGQAWAALYDEVQESLICPACIEDRMTVASCNDSTAEETRQDIQQRLASGQTKDEIIEAYVAKYGEIILAVPRKTGFNMAAWVIPPVAVIGGAMLVYIAVTRWVRNNAGKTKSNATDRFELDEVDEERLNEEIRKYL